MLRELLNIGDKIDIRSLDKNGKPVHNARTYASQLVDFADFDVIYIAAPIVYGKAILLSIGEYYNLCFYSSKGLYQCNCVILSSHKENNLVVTVVRIVTNLEKFQRRQYYRLECIHETDYRVITKEEEILERKLRADDFRTDEERVECKKRLSQFELEWHEGAITDISGGGARFNSDMQMNAGDKIRMRFDILIGNTIKKMLLGADVIASGRIENKFNAFEHRVVFNDIMQRDREDLIKYIFEQERKRRRNDSER